MSETTATALPYSYGKRFFYGSWWSLVATLFAISAFISMVHLAIVAAIVAVAGAWFLGNYAIRIWTWQAKHLVFLFII